MSSAEAVRELHGIRWRDNLAWMEEMKGPRWQKFVKEKQDVWEKCVKGCESETLLLQSELEAAKKLGAAALFQAGPEICVAHHGTVSYTWHWEGAAVTASAAADLDFCLDFPGLVWIVEASSDGSEAYTICCMKKGNAEPLWRHKGVGPYVSIVGGRCYCLESKNHLIYYKLVSWDAKTGANKQVHYEEKDSRYNLELVRGSCKVGILRRQSGHKQDCFFIKANGVYAIQSISLLSRRFIFNMNDPSFYFMYENGKWTYPQTSFQLVRPTKGVPETFVSKGNVGFMITRCQGVRTIWRVSKTARPKLVWRGVANIMMDPWGGQWVRITQPGRDVAWWNCERDERPLSAPCFMNEVSLRHVGEVPYVLVSPFCSKTRVKGLLVIGYGAYGLPTSMSTARWQPLLTRGWAIAIGLWRGGGDDTPEWEDSGRCYGREQVLKDAAAVVHDAQKRVGVSAKETVLYGRSAGGLWVGGLVASGEVEIGGAYMEVPYLDVLRTTTNRDLPLTDLETDEFGLPEARLSHFASMLRWSPMERLERQPKIWQIIRTGLNDREVFAYESAKWVVRSGPKAILAIQGDQGHFVSGAVGIRQQAEDLAILLNLHEG